MYVYGKVVDQDDPQLGLRSVKIIAQSPRTRRQVSSVFTDYQGEFSLALPASAFATDNDNEFMIYLTATRWNYFPPEITLCAIKDTAGNLVPEYPSGHTRLTINLKKWDGKRYSLSRKVYAYGTLCLLIGMALASSLGYWIYLQSAPSSTSGYLTPWSSVETGFEEVRSKFQAFETAAAAVGDDTFRNQQELIKSLPGTDSSTSEIQKWKEMLRREGLASKLKDKFNDFDKKAVDGLVAHASFVGKSLGTLPATGGGELNTASGTNADVRNLVQVLEADLQALKMNKGLVYFREMIDSDELLRSVGANPSIKGLPWPSQREFYLQSISRINALSAEASRIQESLVTIRTELTNLDRKVVLARRIIRQGTAQRIRYWYHVLFWSFLGGCLGLLWSAQRTILDRNFDHGHWPRYAFRLIGSPPMAAVFILLVSYIGFTGQTIAGVDPAKASTVMNVTLACPTAFLSGLFTERLYQRLRSVAEVIFKSDYKV